MTGSGGKPTWRVFISHTSELRDFPKGTSYVAAVERAIIAAGHVPVDMTDFPAADQAPAGLCAERVRGCDVYLGILGVRYGSPVRDKPDVSYTELEFDTATEESQLTTKSFTSPDALQLRVERSLAELEIDREIGHRQGEGAELSNLGNCHHSFGEYRRAIDLYTQALDIDREIGDPLGEGTQLENLGNCYSSLGEYWRAIELQIQALYIVRDIGHRYLEAGALVYLSQAVALLGQALSITDATGDIQPAVEARSWPAHCVGPGLGLSATGCGFGW